MTKKVTRAEVGTALRTSHIDYAGDRYDFVGLVRDVDGNIIFWMYYNVGLDRVVRVAE